MDSAALDRQYRKLQSQLHPDRFGNEAQASWTALQRMSASCTNTEAPCFLQAVQDTASDHSALVSQAYTTLKSPLQRAKYVVMALPATAAERPLADASTWCACSCCSMA